MDVNEKKLLFQIKAHDNFIYGLQSESKYGSNDKLIRLYPK